MKDIPMFSTAYGIASLALGQIPYRGTAYIRVQTVTPGNLEAHVAECDAFCRAAGAQTVFWTAEDALGTPHSTIYNMCAQAFTDPDQLESLFPVTEKTAATWRQIHNDRMKHVDHAVFLTAADDEQLINGGAYFIHREGKLLGIGWLEDDCIRAIASVQPGAGERIAHTLMSLTEGTLHLEVASTNTRAIALYEKLGFLKTGEICRWYKK